MKKKKQNSAHSFTEGMDYKRLNDLNGFEARNAEREQICKEKEIQIVNIAGGFLGIGTIIYAGFAYGLEMSVILFLVVIANNLCNVK